MADQAKSPTVAALTARLRGIEDAENNFIDADIITRLTALRPKDIDALKPPSISAAGGVWVNDSGFCRRLGAILFNVSDETIDELSIRDYQVFLAVVYANFIRFMER